MRDCAQHLYALTVHFCIRIYMFAYNLFDGSLVVLLGVTHSPPRGCVYVCEEQSGCIVFRSLFLTGACMCVYVYTRLCC